MQFCINVNDNILLILFDFVAVKKWQREHSKHGSDCFVMYYKPDRQTDTSYTWDWHGKVTLPANRVITTGESIKNNGRVIWIKGTWSPKIFKCYGYNCFVYGS